MALELAKRMPQLIVSWPRGSAFLEDQFKRAMTSILLNTAEGNGRHSAKERRRFFNIASASAAEVSAVIDAAYAMQWVKKRDYEYFMDRLVQIAKMLYKLP